MLRSLLCSDNRLLSLADERCLLRASAGYPMVLEFLVQDWQVSGEHSLALSLDAMTAEFGTGGPVQSCYGHILDRITTSLDSSTCNVLNLASLLGRRLNDLSLYTLVDLTVSQTMAGL